ATLAGEDRAADPATAQKALDRRMAAARTQAAAGGSGAEIRLENYQTTREDPGNGRPAAWVARQTLELRGTDDGVLLAAVGRLQAAGLALQGLDWTLSPTKRQAAEREAADVALKALQRRAAEAATSLGMRPGPFREITLGDDGAPRPRPLMRMMAMRADAPPPDATRSDQEIAETASGTIVLLP
ncbi:MAG: SIMPL domain-containing protein, partial [Gluconacetobacter diazotrophicus]|nr:SIMPL domain-containing protein [Gluconacetobacter diazotrophicus]